MSDKVSEFDSDYLKEKRAKRRKRQKQIQYSVFGVLLFIIILILIYMFTPLSKISSVEISGNDNTSKNQINKAINVKDNSRMYTYSTTNAQNKLEESTLIKNAEVKKHFPNKLTVKVSEKQIVGLTKKKDKYVPVLEDGTELEDYDGNATDNGPILEGFEKDKKEKIIQALSEMPAKVRGMIAEIKFDPQENAQNQIKLFTTDDIQILGNLNTIGKKMKYYPQMSQSLERDESGELKKAGYIDLSVGASFIPYSGGSTTKSSSDQNVDKGTTEEDKAKDELQSALNKINEKTDKNN
ncbi:cell division protein FtsQ/DivIB [Staphylococcus pseudoxylosus]|mgnify:FL=1|uniref:cell division protein FtsQ/DivIB n=1 Tax=Staphylococcus pseudoxylosus TaxID=2282419 RepID=UPI00298FF0D3|nr:FtsQ-type POTRA domain-containing protein [Staphylococcus pseudoxylosus]MDW8799064.1 FtsQ-type POTRA domain-containing protein [Staphylococcus pseudoxylosus]MEB6044824.1 FtsQ-type POTRA domain-containing protein [Staphylococcus pseudoxylosus]MEB6060206.1 FtsQ-type POTRA domain-containing protein [Staphylococcus pseudoxylosus]MEB7752951.1 FtsQ-type POTRA domain-containing protein [Staphylococcus pseudoxylosus]MEB8007703.1 FtsQ-type POTRA domain-containing protein [Staphylococcus pseudoxylosu